MTTTYFNSTLKVFLPSSFLFLGDLTLLLGFLGLFLTASTIIEALVPKLMAFSISPEINFMSSLSIADEPLNQWKRPPEEEEEEKLMEEEDDRGGRERKD